MPGKMFAAERMTLNAAGSNQSLASRLGRLRIINGHQRLLGCGSKINFRQRRRQPFRFGVEDGHAHLQVGPHGALPAKNFPQPVDFQLAAYALERRRQSPLVAHIDLLQPFRNSVAGEVRRHLGRRGHGRQSSFVEPCPWSTALPGRQEMPPPDLSRLIANLNRRFLPRRQLVARTPRRRIAPTTVGGLQVQSRQRRSLRTACLVVLADAGGSLRNPTSQIVDVPGLKFRASGCLGRCDLACRRALWRQEGKPLRQRLHRALTGAKASVPTVGCRRAVSENASTTDECTFEAIAPTALSEPVVLLPSIPTPSTLRDPTRATCVRRRNRTGGPAHSRRPAHGRRRSQHDETASDRDGRRLSSRTDWPRAHWQSTTALGTAVAVPADKPLSASTACRFSSRGKMMEDVGH